MPGVPKPTLLAPYFRMAGVDGLTAPVALETLLNPDLTAPERPFVLVSQPAPPPQPTGADKTTLVAFMHADRPGALLEILEQFSGRGVNLCRIESRPTKTGLGNYCFSIDAEGHLRDPRLAEALAGLHRICEDVIFLGSYPRADGVRPTIAWGFTDDDFRSAKEWYATLVNPDDD